MSKIYVDEMPTKPCECPFCKLNGGFLRGCILKYEGKYCSFEYDARCRFLVELPKGDKENGYSQD